MNCRVVCALAPLKPLTQTLQERAEGPARQQLASVEQTMRLEDQSVNDKVGHTAALRRRLTDELLRRPARLWDTP